MDRTLTFPEDFGSGLNNIGDLLSRLSGQDLATRLLTNSVLEFAATDLQMLESGTLVVADPRRILHILNTLFDSEMHLISRVDMAINLLVDYRQSWRVRSLLKELVQFSLTITSRGKHTGCLLVVDNWLSFVMNQAHFDFAKQAINGGMDVRLVERPESFDDQTGDIVVFSGPGGVSCVVSVSASDYRADVMRLRVFIQNDEMTELSTNLSELWNSPNAINLKSV